MDKVFGDSNSHSGEIEGEYAGPGKKVPSPQPSHTYCVTICYVHEVGLKVSAQQFLT